MRKLLVALLLLPLSAQAADLPASLAPGGNGSRVSAVQVEFDSLWGCIPFEVDSSTTPALIFTGAGVVERICAVGTSTLAQGPTFGVAEDSNTISGMGIAGNLANTATLVAGRTRLISPAAMQEGASSPATAANSGCASAENAPIQFSNGLVVAASTNTITVNGCYRPIVPSAVPSPWW